MTNKNNLPTYFEELKLDSESTISAQDIISQLKQQIPADYLEIIVEEGNYCGSTNSKWKDKSLSERYIFTYEEKQIQIDIPHTILDKLGLEKGEDITQSLYLDPKVLIRPETYRGITIKNEAEIILVNPNKIVMKEKETQTELDNKELEKTKSELEREKEKNNKLNNEIIQLKADLVKAQQEKQNLQNTINSLQNQIITKNNQISDLNSTISGLQSQIKQKDSQISSLQSTNNNLQSQLNNHRCPSSQYNDFGKAILKEIYRYGGIASGYYVHYRPSDGTFYENSPSNTSWAVAKGHLEFMSRDIKKVLDIANNYGFTSEP